MKTKSCHNRMNANNKIILIACLFVLIFATYSLASVSDKDSLTQLQEQARFYRQQGVQSQQIGDLDAARNSYQKAIELDPAFAAAYNDLGVIYEAIGLEDKAKENYLKAIKTDPNYLSAYTNLALFCEDKRDLKNAVIYWSKRAELGDANDPWTKKAASRLNDIRIVTSKKPLVAANEQNVLNLMKDVSVRKGLAKQDNTVSADEHFIKAKKYFDKEDYASAIKEALDAQYLDPDSKEIEAFIEKAGAKVLMR